MLGIPSIAVSLASMQSEYEDFRFAAQFTNSLLEKIKDFQLPKKSILNVNIPSLPAEDISGVEITELGGKLFTNDYEKRIDPRGKVYYWLAGELKNEPVDAPTDIAAIRNNKISITPITYEMTKTETITDLDNILCGSGNCDWY